MPSLPLLVSLLISGLREKNVQSTNVAENVKHAIEDDDGRPKDHRIDFSKPETDDSSPGQELSPGVGDYGAQRRMYRMNVATYMMLIDRLQRNLLPELSLEQVSRL